MADVVVVGGGLVGAACAYELAGDGTSVVVVDAHDAGRATDAGAGILSPETALSASSDDAFVALGDLAGEHYRALVPELAEAGAPDPCYAVCGALRIAFREVDDPFYAENRARSFARHADVLVDVAPDDACAMFPPLAGVRAAYFNPRGARVDGRAMAAALVHGAGARGVQWQHARASRVRVDHARVTAVETVDGDELACGTVVVAGGAWTPEIARSLGCDVAVRPQRGQIVHLRVGGDGAGDTARWPVLQPVLSHYVVPWPDGRVALGATMEEVGFDSRPTVGGIRQLLSEGLRLAPGLADATFLEVRVGLRPVSDDDLPVLGAVPGVDGAFVATGHGANGLLLGPVSARLLAQLVRGDSPALDLAPFAIDRFAR
ncbi:MAG TPA: FAD-dependent oxidoreductase [Acidimicrobiia bacterium]|nr:FAD-dependent oxidoreductase [Acidimicrobiia bacterium]